MKKSKPRSHKRLIFIAALLLLLASIAYPNFNTDSTDLIKGGMTGISITLFGAFFLKILQRKMNENR